METGGQGARHPALPESTGSSRDLTNNLRRSQCSQLPTHRPNGQPYLWLLTFVNVSSSTVRVLNRQVMGLSSMGKRTSEHDARSDARTPAAQLRPGGGFASGLPRFPTLGHGKPVEAMCLACPTTSFASEERFTKTTHFNFVTNRVVRRRTDPGSEPAARPAMRRRGDCRRNPAPAPRRSNTERSGAPARHPSDRCRRAHSANQHLIAQNSTAEDKQRSRQSANCSSEIEQVAIVIWLSRALFR